MTENRTDVQSGVDGLLRLAQEVKATDPDKAESGNCLASRIDCLTGFLQSTAASIRGSPIRTDYDEAWLAEQAFYQTLDERTEMLMRDTYYCAQVNIAGRTAESMSSELRAAAAGKPNGPYSLPTLVAAFADTCRDFAVQAVVLLQDYAGLRNVNCNRRVIAANVRHSFQVYTIATHLWAGVHKVKDPWASALVMRQAIEVRLRHATNIMGVKTATAYWPVSVSQLIAVLSEEDEVTCAVEWGLMKRLYRWANLYAHTGAMDYPWLPRYALKVLEPLLCGVVFDGGKGWSLDAGIEMTEESLGRVEKAVMALYKDKGATSLVGFRMKPTFVTPPKV